MLSADQALQTILREAKTLSSEKIELSGSLGRTLAEDIVARVNIPPFDSSAANGMAICSQDVKHASNRRPVVLGIVGEASAGSVYKKSIERGEAG